jgi:hypothetical protein
MPEPADGLAAVPVAVLIDADNVAADFLEAVLAEAARFGRPTIRRVYGNWTGTELQGWKKLLHEHALQPVQQFAYVPGKNATDTALIIDAMDLLHGGQAEVFCLVSSDSDYTRLAMRLRESGKTVVGMGRAQTPKSLIKACDRFVALDTLAQGKQKTRAVTAEQERGDRGRRPAAGDRGGRRERQEPAPAKGLPQEAVELLRSAVEDAEDEEGWADVGAVGNILYANNPDFDPRSYGKRQLVALLDSLRSEFEVRRPPEGQRGGSRVRLRN